jgi:uncharacterized damage-inducible protein DinB
MTHYGGKQLAASFRTVRNNTIKVAEEIPESHYDFRPAPGCRSISETLAHLAVVHWVQQDMQTSHVSDLATVNFGALIGKTSAEEAKPRSKAELIAFLQSEGEKFAAYLESLSDEFLAQTVKMPPGAEPATKSRLEMLMSPKEHEMHHRGQLMVIQRMLGLTPHLTRDRQARAAQLQSAQAGVAGVSAAGVSAAGSAAR